MDTSTDDMALHLAAMKGDLPQINHLLKKDVDINVLDKFGYTPLDLAITHQQTAAALLLLHHGSLINNGAKPLFLALSMQNQAIAQAIIHHPDFDGDILAFRAFHWKQVPILNFLIQQQVHMPTTKTLMTVKMLAHRFSLEGDINVYLAPFLDKKPLNITLEGYYNQMTAQESYLSFQEYVTALKGSPPPYFPAYLNTLEALSFAAQPDINGKAYMDRLYEGFLLGEPKTLFMLSGWEGHAVGIVIKGDILYKCNRGEGSDGAHGIIAYKINQFEGFSPDLFDKILAAEGSPFFLQAELDKTLDLTEIGRFEAIPQTVGNCTWISAIEGIHAILLAELSSLVNDKSLAYTLAKQIHSQWENFDLDSSIACLPSHFDSTHQQGIINEILVKILSAHHDAHNHHHIDRALHILQHVDDPKALLNQVHDADFQQAVYKALFDYIGIYQYQHWSDQWYFWLNESLSPYYLGFTNKNYEQHLKDIAFGGELNALVQAHPTLLTPPTPLKWEEVLSEPTPPLAQEPNNLTSAPVLPELTETTPLFM